MKNFPNGVAKLSETCHTGVMPNNATIYNAIANAIHEGEITPGYCLDWSPIPGDDGFWLTNADGTVSLICTHGLNTVDQYEVCLYLDNAYNTTQEPTGFRDFDTIEECAEWFRSILPNWVGGATATLVDGI